MIIALSPLLANTIYWQNIFSLQNRNLKDVATILTLCLLWTYSLSQSKAWDSGGIDNTFDIYRAPLLAAAKVFLAFSAYSYLFKSSFSRGWTITQILLTITGIIISRALINSNFLTSINYDENMKPLTYLVVCHVSDFNSICEDFDRDHKTKVNFILMKFDARSSAEKLSLQIYKKLSDTEAEGLILKADSSTADRILKSVTHLRKPYNLQEVLFISTTGLLEERMKHMNTENWFRLNKPKLLESQRFIKRGVDILFSFVALVLLTPLFLVVALIIKLTSKGPVFYISKRVGRFNKPFTFIKFRTMIDLAAEQREQVLGAGVNENLGVYLADNRITSIGKILRRWSIDETPQFIHVLFGTMSIVGPRPILFEELADVPPDTTMRFVVKPGLTGIWQVSGRKSVLWNDRMRQDLLYIETWSLLGDVRLILKTVGAVFTGRGAA